MQDEIVKLLDVFWGQAEVGSYAKFQGSRGLRRTSIVA